MQNQYRRQLKLDVPRGQSVFLLGARKTGKSTFLKGQYPDAVYYDLLKSEEYLRLLKAPQELRQEVQALPKAKLKHPIIIDEVQRIPMLLNEVHWLIENTEAYFILCGSSARKLKAQGVNLLAGRAWNYYFYPLVYPEIPEFDLLRALNQGLIPSHYASKNWLKSIKAYVHNYLLEEVKSEGLVRNLPAFSRFFDVAAHSNGELINFSNIAQDCGVDSKTIKEYYQILVDTLVGYYVYPFKSKQKRNDLVATPKFYLFDSGVVSYLRGQHIHELTGYGAGMAFEQYVLMEIMAYRGIHDLDFDICFWRNREQQEVDFVLNKGKIAIEVKIKPSPRLSELKGLKAFLQYAQPQKAMVVCHAPRKRVLHTEQGDIEICPWQSFLKQLWSGKFDELLHRYASRTSKCE